MSVSPVADLQGSLDSPPADSKVRVGAFLRSLQDSICQALEAIDGEASFVEDEWQRPEGGGGRSRVMTNGAVFEQGGVNFSEVWGDALPPSIVQQRPLVQGHSFFATGTSMVLHPLNPFVPTVHLNYRYFEAGPVWWFGGGIDLTPFYPFREDVIHFHQTLKDTCDLHSPLLYPIFKAWCDEYFFLRHRQETRGVGGIFFDYQDGAGALYHGSIPDGEADRLARQVQPPLTRSWQQLFDFVQSCGNAFLDAYLPIVNQRAHTPFSSRERDFQLYRRGRYVEFNLLYDRGTIFGLQTNGRTESILMSLPPLVRWLYNFHPLPDSPEALLYQFLSPQNWLQLDLNL